ncbi:MAG: HpcH/HpaI aldolase/citrate lyase family protein [Dehalococcoidia bacterium]
MYINPKSFYEPLAIGAPEPLKQIPAVPMRMIHFFDPSNSRMIDKMKDIIPTVDVLLGNLEDAVASDNKIAARDGLVTIANANDFKDTMLWTRVNSLDSPWFLDDVITLVNEIGNKLDVIMLPKVNGPWDINFLDQLLAQLEAKNNIKKPIMIHAILETAIGVANVEDIAIASPRMQGISLGPADLAASRRMKTTRVGGGHPGYLVRNDPNESNPEDERQTAQQDLWHYTMARMVDACSIANIFPFYGPFGDIGDSLACEDQFRNAFLMGCVGAWSIHPSQIDIAKKVFSPPPEEVIFAKKIITEMGDGSGVAMIDGKMQDDATVKQAQVMIKTAELIAKRDKDLAKLYNL